MPFFPNFIRQTGLVNWVRVGAKSQYINYLARFTQAKHSIFIDIWRFRSSYRISRSLTINIWRLIPPSFATGFRGLFWNQAFLWAARISDYSSIRPGWKGKRKGALLFCQIWLKRRWPPLLFIAPFHFRKMLTNIHPVGIFIFGWKPSSKNARSGWKVLNSRYPWRAILLPIDERGTNLARQG